MKSYIKKMLRDFYVTNTCSLKQVQPDFRFDARKRTFYLNSEAGLLIYRPKDLGALTRFRDQHLNLFLTVSQIHEPKKRKRALFSFYRALRSLSGVKYRANLRTRIEGMFSWNSPG